MNNDRLKKESILFTLDTELAKFSLLDMDFFYLFLLIRNEAISTTDR